MTGVAADRQGNVCATGWNSHDIRTIKFDPVGNRLWLSVYNALPNPVATAFTLDGEGNSYVGGYATGASVGLSGADLPDHAYWEKWFPADWVSEMREQIRLWFYSQCFMAITLAGRQPYGRVLTYENVVDETGREMHKSWGNAIDLDDALERMGADTMRWLYCSQNPAQELRFGYGMAEEVKRRFLTFWNSVKFLVDYGNIAGFRPAWQSLQPEAAEPLDRWLVERTNAFVIAAESNYEAYVDDLSNWYIRRSRRRFWADDEAALRTLWYALVQALRALAPIRSSASFSSIALPHDLCISRPVSSRTFS